MILQSIDNMTTTDGKTILNTTELAERLDVSITTASEYLRTGVVKGAKKAMDGCWYVLETNVEAHERSLQSKHDNRVSDIQGLFA